MQKWKRRWSLRWLPRSLLQKRWTPMSTPNGSSNGAPVREAQYSLSVRNPNGRELTFSEAIREALTEEMHRDPRVFIIGEDVAEAGTVFKVLKGMVDEFGPERVLDSPISEAGIAGIGVGAAITGMRPVV